MTTFAHLRQVNGARAGAVWPNCNDWALSAWSNATLGELGEAANVIKKIERGDFTLEDARDDLAKEFADVAIYLDILAMQAGVDLGMAVLKKFNEVSERVGSNIRLTENGPCVIDENGQPYGQLNPPCHRLPRRRWCDHSGPGGFMGHTCLPTWSKS